MRNIKTNAIGEFVKRYDERIVGSIAIVGLTSVLYELLKGLVKWLLH
jgi:hypothetical protein